MSKNTGSSNKTGIVRGLTQVLNPANDKRETGKFIDVKEDGSKFKGVAVINTPNNKDATHKLCDDLDALIQKFVDDNPNTQAAIVIGVLESVKYNFIRRF